MPAKTKRMQRFMAICSHHPEKARGKCPPRNVAEEFSHKPAGGYRKRKKKMNQPQKNALGFF